MQPGTASRHPSTSRPQHFSPSCVLITNTSSKCPASLGTQPKPGVNSRGPTGRNKPSPEARRGFVLIASLLQVSYSFRTRRQTTSMRRMRYTHTPTHTHKHMDIRTRPRSAFPLPCRTLPSSCCPSSPLPLSCPPATFPGTPGGAECYRAQLGNFWKTFSNTSRQF